ncbi:MBL fold metallo-hydrolase [Caldicellulosiruptor naganoensis]|uniref:MBL fold metallo-hydrolase n=1 Tax=Caldicellulosiruptor naganoensis TaxID=29324 RepID=A0ABY7BGS9_9FIRM|nr:MBL fold metallo-hydrolase [Caldicellulosiruptor naganoensis]WAM32043.1 MBL fold metallo-hydrolase [Caldicellulosiruptor naganoensis]
MSYEIIFCPLYSGSSGNVILISYKDTTILVDAGVSFRKLTCALNKIGFNKKIDAILLSHDHSDHVKCAGVYFRKLNVPIITNYRTWEAIKNSIGKVDERNVHLIETGTSFSIGNIGIDTFSIPHDAKDPMGFCFYVGNKKISISTDLGHVNEKVAQKIDFSDIILLEANHDIEMLLTGPYPYYLKQRIKSDIGHLSNEQAAQMILKLNLERTKRIYLGHLSEENNHPDVALMTVKSILKEKGVFESFDFSLDVAQRYQPSLCSVL